MKKVLKWIGIALLLLVVLPLVVVIVINQFDDKLDPKAAAYGAPRAETIPPAENGYYGVLALGAPDGGDGMAYARAWIAEGRAAAKENRAENRPQVRRTKRPDLCDPAQAQCITMARDKVGDITTHLDAYREDLERYEKLLAMKRYEEVLDYGMRVDAHLPSYQGVSTAQRAHLARAALALNAGSVEDALAMMERDLAFHRVMLGGARTMIGKMIASSTMQRSLAFAAQAMQHHAAALKPHAARLAAMMPALVPEALSLAVVFESEFAFVKAAYEMPGSAGMFVDGDHRAVGWGEKIALTLFYKKNATINKAYGHYAAMAAASQKPALDIAAEWHKLPKPGVKLGFAEYVNNPVGNILFGVAMPLFEDYSLRMHDLDGFNRLVGLRVAMLEAGIDGEGAEAFIARADARFHDPYTGKPMTWGASTGRLSFQVSGATAKRKFVFAESGRHYVPLVP